MLLLAEDVNLNSNKKDNIKYYDMKINFIRISIILILAAINISNVFSQQADAGRDTVMLKGAHVPIGPSHIESTWCYSWKSKDPSTISDRKSPNPDVYPDSTAKYFLTVVGPDFEFTSKDEMKVTVKNTKVSFSQYKSQRYGFDGYADNKDMPWKSVKVDDFDFVVASVKPAEDSTYVRFKSMNPLFPIRPDKAARDSQLIVLEPIEKGHTELHANFKTADGETISRMNMVSYHERILSVAVIPIIEENDDLQIIKPGNGEADARAITPGINGILESTKGGDDEILSDMIYTGANGRNESIRLGDDEEIIPINHGKPNTNCLSNGFNNFWDTKANLGDDAWDGDFLTTGPNGICNTNAMDTNSVINSVDLSTLQNYLNKVYSQAVITWYVYILPTAIVNYDKNRDDSLDFPIGGTGWNSEMQEIINKAGEITLFDKNVFLVNKGKAIDGNGDYTPLLGFMKFNQEYGFIFSDRGTSDINNTIAHELGHGLGLHHTFETDANPLPDIIVQDEENLMHPTTNTGWLLRKGQWDQINP
jgi:hypothetical protein